MRENAEPFRRSRVAVVMAIAQRTARARWRGRQAVGATVIAALAWAASHEVLTSPRAALQVGAMILALAATIVAAGGLGDDLDSGAIMYDLLASASPADLATGSALGTLLALGAPFGLLAAVAAPLLIPAVGIATTLLLFAGWGAVTAGWVAVATCVGTVTPGKGNAIVVLPLFMASGLAASDLPIGSLPEAISAPIRAAWSLLPLSSHFGSWNRAVLDLAAWPVVETALLVTVPLVWTAAAIGLLTWRVRRGLGDA